MTTIMSENPNKLEDAGATTNAIPDQGNRLNDACKIAWIIKLERQGTPVKIFKGGIAVGRSGLVLTTLNSLNNSFDMFGRDDSGAPWRKLRVRSVGGVYSMSRTMGLILLELVPGKDNDGDVGAGSGTKGALEHVLETRGRVLEGDSVVAVLHPKGVAFTSKLGHCSRSFSPEQTVIPNFEGTPQVTLANESRRKLLEVRNGPISGNLTAAHVIPAREVVMNPYLHPQLPLLQLQVLDNIREESCSGCPVFHKNGGYLLGLFFRTFETNDYFIPTCVVLRFLEMENVQL